MSGEGDELRPTAHLLGLVLRHQLGSVVATVVDFATMIVIVSGFGVPPVAGTAIGAATGALTNFSLGRRWIFRAHDGERHGQAMRYASVWAGSLGLNAFGMWLGHEKLAVPYVLVRVVVAIAVSVGWNFPMQRYFVFHRDGRA